MASVKESLVVTGEDSPMGHLMLSVKGAPKGTHRPVQAARRAQRAEKALTPERAAEMVQRAGSGVPAVFAHD